MKRPTLRQEFALGLNDQGAEDLIARKVYQVLPDAQADAKGFMRVIDESGENYLYPSEYFLLLNLPQAAQKALSRSSRTLRAA